MTYFSTERNVSILNNVVRSPYVLLALTNKYVIIIIALWSDRLF